MKFFEEDKNFVQRNLCPRKLASSGCLFYWTKVTKFVRVKFCPIRYVKNNFPNRNTLSYIVKVILNSLLPIQYSPSHRYREKGAGEQKLWGQDTKLTTGGDELAYHHFKPSHFANGPERSKVVVSHRHYGNRTHNL